VQPLLRAEWAGSVGAGWMMVRGVADHRGGIAPARGWMRPRVFGDAPPAPQWCDRGIGSSKAFETLDVGHEVFPNDRVTLEMEERP